MRTAAALLLTLFTACASPFAVEPTPTARPPATATPRPTPADTATPSTTPELSTPGSVSGFDAHEGAMAFARGCMMRIRNLIDHDDGWDEREALESLAALSLLARWTESATVIEGN